MNLFYLTLFGINQNASRVNAFFLQADQTIRPLHIRKLKQIKQAGICRGDNNFRFAA
jgi:hypothetical protein